MNRGGPTQPGPNQPTPQEVPGQPQPPQPRQATSSSPRTALRPRFMLLQGEQVLQHIISSAWGDLGNRQDSYLTNLRVVKVQRSLWSGKILKEIPLDKVSSVEGVTAPPSPGLLFLNGSCLVAAIFMLLEAGAFELVQLLPFGLFLVFLALAIAHRPRQLVLNRGSMRLRVPSWLSNTSFNAFHDGIRDRQLPSRPEGRGGGSS